MEMLMNGLTPAGSGLSDLSSQMEAQSRRMAQKNAQLQRAVERVMSRQTRRDVMAAQGNFMPFNESDIISVS